MHSKIPLLAISAGWTDTLPPFTLKLNGVPVVLTGKTVNLMLRNASGTLITPGGTITILNQDDFPGQLTYTPHANDFQFEANRYTLAQTYQIRWKVTDSNGKVVTFPNGQPDEISVYRV